MRATADADPSALPASLPPLAFAEDEGPPPPVPVPDVSDEPPDEDDVEDEETDVPLELHAKTEALDKRTSEAMPLAREEFVMWIMVGSKWLKGTRNVVPVWSRLDRMPREQIQTCPILSLAQIPENCREDLATFARKSAPQGNIIK